jgi:hypothetical protein
MELTPLKLTRRRATLAPCRDESSEAILRLERLPSDDAMQHLDAGSEHVLAEFGVPLGEIVMPMSAHLLPQVSMLPSLRQSMLSFRHPHSLSEDISETLHK